MREGCLVLPGRTREGCPEEGLPGKEMEVRLEKRPLLSAPTLPGRETAFGGWEPGGALLGWSPGQSSLGRARCPAAASTCSSLRHAKESGFTLKVMQKSEASYPGQGVAQVCFSGWATLVAG